MILSSEPEWERKGFWDAVRSELAREYEDEEMARGDVRNLDRFIPDLFKVTDEGYKPDQRTIWILEIEDTSVLSRDKLRRIVDLWWVIDSTDTTFLRLLVVDRYGKNRREIDLTELAFALIREEAGV